MNNIHTVNMDELDGYANSLLSLIKIGLIIDIDRYTEKVFY